MDIQLMILYALGFVTTAFAVYIIYIGSLGLIKRHPLLFPSHHYMFFMFAIFLLILMVTFLPILEGKTYGNPLFSIVPFVNLVLVALWAFMLRQQMSGYMILGVYDDTFRDALMFALKKLNFAFQENISKIKLIDLHADLQASVASWMGIAQINIKQSQHSRSVHSIAATMREYYKDESIKVNYLAFILYLVMGIAVLVLVGVIAFSVP